MSSEICTTCGQPVQYRSIEGFGVTRLFPFCGCEHKEETPQDDPSIDSGLDLPIFQDLNFDRVVLSVGIHSTTRDILRTLLTRDLERWPRSITIFGPPLSGKTRLSVSFLKAYAHPTRYIDLQQSIELFSRTTWASPESIEYLQNLATDAPIVCIDHVSTTPMASNTLRSNLLEFLKTRISYRKPTIYVTRTLPEVAAKKIGISSTRDISDLLGPVISDVISHHICDSDRGPLFPWEMDPQDLSPPPLLIPVGFTKKIYRKAA